MNLSSKLRKVKLSSLLNALFPIPILFTVCSPGSFFLFCFQMVNFSLCYNERNCKEMTVRHHESILHSGSIAFLGLGGPISTRHKCLEMPGSHKHLIHWGTLLQVPSLFSPKLLLSSRFNWWRLGYSISFISVSFSRGTPDRCANWTIRNFI